MKLYNTHLKKEVDFIPIKEGRVKIYVCGPTVYDDSHLGHARSAIVFDLLRRVLIALGYEVEFMKNFTDIDDKIINKVHETNQTLQEITTHYIERYLAEMEALHVLRADIEPKATTSLEAMQNFIQKLLNQDIAYIATNGDVYFDISKDEAYYSLSKRDESESISRVEENLNKRNPQDFALWKACKEQNDICFESSFSKGRPGWHIECSAMIDKYLAYTDEAYAIDIHGGGIDLLFPHHENEAAQTRCANHHELAKYWVHNGFVNIDGEKMSKSLGNSFFLKDALVNYDGEILRYYLLSTHYRQNLNFNEIDLLASKKRLDKLYRLKKRVQDTKSAKVSEAFKTMLLEALSQDLNISKALAVIDGMVQEANEALDSNPKDKALKKELIANIEYITQVLGIGGMDAYLYFQLGIDEALKTQIENLLAQRDAAKKAKEYAKADSLREELLALGISIMDTPKGTFYEKLS